MIQAMTGGVNDSRSLTQLQPSPWRKRGFAIDEMGTSRWRLTVPTGRSGRPAVVHRCLDLLRSLESRPRANGPAGIPLNLPEVPGSSRQAVGPYLTAPGQSSTSRPPGSVN